MKKMQKIVRAMAAVAAAGALAGFAIAGIGDGSQTYRGSVDPARVAGARAALRVEDDGATLVADGLPQPVGAYQAWVMPKDSESPQPSVRFLLRAGSASVAVPGADAEDAAAVLVSREPRDGSGTPSEEPVVTINLS
jgi:Anti-sigma-K factor rskA